MIPWSSMDTKDTIEENAGKDLVIINYLLEAIISLFSIDNEDTSGGDDSVKDSLVFQGFPKDTMDVNVQKELGIMIYILMLPILYLLFSIDSE